jgi:hypothetical protein
MLLYLMVAKCIDRYFQLWCHSRIGYQLNLISIPYLLLIPSRHWHQLLELIIQYFCMFMQRPLRKWDLSVLVSSKSICFHSILYLGASWILTYAHKKASCVLSSLYSWPPFISCPSLPFRINSTLYSHLLLLKRNRLFNCPSQFYSCASISPCKKPPPAV